MSSPDLSLTLFVGASLGLALTAIAPQPAAARACDVDQCTVNTAELRGVDIKGLNVNGVTNLDGVRLVPGSVQLTASSTPLCPANGRGGLNLGVDSGMLIARDPVSSAVVASSLCMAGATFQIDIPLSHGKVTTMSRQTLRIGVIDTVDTWYADASLRTSLLSYQLINLATGISICPLKEAFMESWQVDGLDTIPTATVAKWKDTTDRAVIVQGETYLETGQADGARSTPDWFNIACAGSAIAKLRLLGYDPMVPGGVLPAERAATLKMLTARYVRNSSQAWTRTGTPLRWEPTRRINGELVTYLGGPDSTKLGPYEADWTGEGPICVAHTRLASTTNGATTVTEANDLKRIEDAGGATCAILPGGQTHYWRTRTVSHIAH